MGELTEIRARGRKTAFALLTFLMTLVATPCVAQTNSDTNATRSFSQVLTIDPERLMADSLLGREMSAVLVRRREALADENRRFELSLREEELALTKKRAEVDPTAFRLLADAFDDKVQGIRRSQDAKERELTQLAEQQRRAFLAQMQQILAELMVENEAAVILDRRSTFLSFETVDITDRAIARIDSRSTSAPQTPAPTDN